MSEVSAGDQTAYAAAKQVWAKPVLNVEPLNEVATADVNDTSITYPLTSLTVDNTSADWLDGLENMLFRIEEQDGTVICWGVLNQDNAANTFYPDVKSDGDFGYATNEGITIEDDDVIRIYNNRPNWAMISRVTEAGIQNKRWNKTYTNEGTKPPPVCILGHDLQADVDSGTGKATFEFDASNSYDWLATYSISTYLYTLPTGAIVTAGSVNTANVTFTVPAGIYIVQCKITSTSGVSRSGFRTIYANDTSSNKSFGENYSIEAVAGDATDIDGWEGQFTVLGDISSVVYPGVKCHWYVPVYYDGSRLTDNDAFIDVFVGYLTEINITTDSNRVKRTTLTFKSPLKLAKLLPSATQTFEEVVSPQTWTEVIKGLSDPAFAAYYVLQYHTTMIDNHDFIYESSIRDLRRRTFGFPADTITAHLQIDGQILRGNIGCRSDGTITVTQEPSLQNTTDRDTRDDKFTWTEDNVRDRLAIVPTFRPKIAYLIMGAVAYDGDPNGPMIAYAAKAPGNAQAQGVTKTNLPDISITVDGGAAELYGIIGHWFAMLNNPLAKIDIPISKMFDIGEPADPDWHTLNINESDYLPITMDLFGVRWSSTMRMRPVRITRQWARNNGTWIKTITQQSRIESFGRPGVFHPTYKGEIEPYINPLSGWLDGLNITMPDINIDFNTIGGGLLTSGGWNEAWSFNDFGISGNSSDWNSFSPSYTSVGKSLEGDIVAQALDGGGGGDGYLIISNPDDQEVLDDFLDVYEGPNVKASPQNWSLDHTITNVTAMYYRNDINIASDATQSMIVWTESTSVYYEYKPAAGVWQAAALIGSSSTTFSKGEQVIPPIALDGNDAWTIGKAAGGIHGYVLMKQSTPGGAWSEVPNYPVANGNGQKPKAIVRSGTNVFVSVPFILAGSIIKHVLYRVDDATSTWTNVSPAGNFAPVRHNAIVADSGNVWMIATDLDDIKKIFVSDDDGATWEDKDETFYDWLVRLSSDDVFALGGNNALGVTNNAFGTIHSRLGQWGEIGSIGIMQGFTSEALI
jgi:hypothetical protein